LRAAGCNQWNGTVGDDLSIGCNIAAKGRFDNICADLDGASHGPGDVFRMKDDFAARIARIDVANDRHFIGRGLTYAIGRDAKIGRFGRVADERRDRERIGPKTHGVERLRNLFARRVVRANRRTLNNQRNASGVRLAVDIKQFIDGRITQRENIHVVCHCSRVAAKHLFFKTKHNKSLFCVDFVLCLYDHAQTTFDFAHTASSFPPLAPNVLHRPLQGGIGIARGAGLHRKPAAIAGIFQRLEAGATAERQRSRLSVFHAVGQNTDGVECDSR
jgi:hypothetical protein